jgi:hypothetical protein
MAEEAGGEGRRRTRRWQGGGAGVEEARGGGAEENDDAGGEGGGGGMQEAPAQGAMVVFYADANEADNIFTFRIFLREEDTLSPPLYLAQLAEVEAASESTCRCTQACKCKAMCKWRYQAVKSYTEPQKCFVANARLTTPATFYCPALPTHNEVYSGEDVVGVWTLEPGETKSKIPEVQLTRLQVQLMFLECLNVP